MLTFGADFWWDFWWDLGDLGDLGDLWDFNIFMVKKPPEATEAYENLLSGLCVFFLLKKRDKYFRVFDIRCFYTFKLVNSGTIC